MQRPCFETVEQYGAFFTSAEYWRPYVEAVCNRHHLEEISAVHAGLPGSNPVFIVNGRYAVKFYTHFFSGDKGFPMELECYGLIKDVPDLPAPSLVAHGDLFEQGSEWHWPYIITTVVPGTSFGEVSGQVGSEGKKQLAKYLGTLMRRIHSLPLQQLKYHRPDWDAFVDFIEERRSKCKESHLEWNALTVRLIDQIDDYLLPNEQLFDIAMRPHMLHCDLNRDHVLGVFHGENWRPAGIIDFGDGKIGDRLYDFIALHIGLFRCDKSLLRLFMDAYGIDSALRKQFVQRAMCYTLLHEFNVLSEVVETVPAASEASDLEELADLIWGTEA